MLLPGSRSIMMVNGGTAPDPLVWDQGSKPKFRKLGIRVTEDLASLPGPPLGFLILIGFRCMQVTLLMLT